MGLCKIVYMAVCIYVYVYLCMKQQQMKAFTENVYNLNNYNFYSIIYMYLSGKENFMKICFHEKVMKKIN